MSAQEGVAYLSHRDRWTSFTYGDTTVTFMTGLNLRRYLEVTCWDDGYLEVIRATVTPPDARQEDYIDLRPILENLYMDADTFLAPIRRVEIRYDDTDTADEDCE